jgi:hypothetical protein
VLPLATSAEPDKRPETSKLLVQQAASYVLDDALLEAVRPARAEQLELPFPEQEFLDHTDAPASCQAGFVPSAAGRAAKSRRAAPSPRLRSFHHSESQ